MHQQKYGVVTYATLVPGHLALCPSDFLTLPASISSLLRHINKRNFNLKSISFSWVKYSVE